MALTKLSLGGNNLYVYDAILPPSESYIPAGDESIEKLFWRCSKRISHQDICNENPRKGIARPQSQIPQSFVCERFIYSQDQSKYFPAAE